MAHVMVKGHKNRQIETVIKSRHIPAGSIATADLADDAVTNAKLGALQEKTLLYEYDFAVSGGSHTTDGGVISLTGKGNTTPTPLPDNAVITNVTIEGVTDNTSGGSATIALGWVGAAAGFLAATAFDHAMWNVNAVTSGGPVVANGKTTGQVAVIATIATASLTAGKWYVWVTYFEGA